MTVALLPTRLVQGAGVGFADRLPAGRICAAPSVRVCATAVREANR